MKLIDNFKQDLIKSLKKPLLIELNNKDLNLFGDDGLNKAALYSQYIYNEFINSSESTNLVFIDADKYEIDDKEDKKIILLEEIINLTSEQIESQKKINIVKDVVNGALSYFTGPLIKNVIGDYVDAGIDEIVDLLGDSIKDVIDFLGKEFNYNFTDKVLNEITNKVNKTLNDSTSNMLEEEFIKKLNLSKKAEKKLDTLSSQFNKDLTPVGIFSLVVQLLISVAINDEENKFSNNKLIFINNPHKLDENSLAVLSLLFSLAKDLKEKEKHTGISVVYCYSDEEFQPYQELKDDKYKLSKKLLDEQRRFTQRYSMLERPSSDIPNIAVKSSTFVGRGRELKILKEQFDKSKKDSNLKNLEVIKADPGIGKTKLVKKHIEQIEKSEKNGKSIIQLKLLNQVGHSSTNTGLSSLKHSILNEAKRLETIKTLENTLIHKLKNLGKSKIISTIEELLGVNNIIEISSSVKDAYDLEKNTKELLEQSSEDINNKSKKSKEQQFEDIREAILKLQSLCDETLPIILFIDDIQWIDDDSSEFILKYFTQTLKFNTYIVATQRTSDATTALKLAQENSSLNAYKISLLQQVGIKTDKFIENPENITKLVINIIDLKGLDEKSLTELISLTIDYENKNEEKKQKDEILAKSIIKNLINENQKDKEYVNTLFAIETINMLCDEKLYSTEHKYTKDGKEVTESIKELILQNPLRYNESLQEFSKTLEETFKILNAKYNDAFEHANSDKEFKQQFNLMAYAVLEERLHILHEYFDAIEEGKYGNAAVNTLLFSSLLGTPFNSQIVKNVLEELSNTEEKLLQSLKKYIKKSKQCNLNEVHYEIIEEVYEILSRYIQFDSTYSYKHNLLEIFLEKQFEYLIDKKLKFANENRIEFYSLIIDILNKEKEKYKSLFENYEYLYYLNNLNYKLNRKRFELNKDYLAEYYYSIKSLNNFNSMNFDFELEMQLIFELRNLSLEDNWISIEINNYINNRLLSHLNKRFSVNTYENIKKTYNLVENLGYNENDYTQRREFFNSLKNYIIISDNLELIIKLSEENEKIANIDKFLYFNNAHFIFGFPKPIEIELGFFKELYKKLLYQKKDISQYTQLKLSLILTASKKIFQNKKYIKKHLDEIFEKFEKLIKKLSSNKYPSEYELQISYIVSKIYYEKFNDTEKSIIVGSLYTKRILEICKNSEIVYFKKSYLDYLLKNLLSIYEETEKYQEAIELLIESLEIFKDNEYIKEKLEKFKDKKENEEQMLDDYLDSFK